MHIPWELFKIYILGTIQEDDLKELEEWRNISEENGQIFDEVMSDQAFKSNLLSGKWDDVTVGWQLVQSRLSSPTRILKLNRRTLFLAASGAAVIVLVLGIAFGMWIHQIQQNGIQIAEEYSFIYSPRGQRTRVLLPDQTKVWLNSESSLRYSTNFNKKGRVVTLIGEGYFEVSKNPHKPFFVNAREVKIKVYGTSFNIKAFPDDKSIETTLIEGSLSVIPMGIHGDSEEEILLKPNDKCIYNVDRTPVQIENSKTQSVDNESVGTSDSLIIPIKDLPSLALARNAYIEPEKKWKDGKLVFKDETFGELKVKLERWYNVNLHFESERIKGYRFTGIFEKETINEAMEALLMSSQKSYTYRISFRDIYLK